MGIEADRTVSERVMMIDRFAQHESISQPQASVAHSPVAEAHPQASVANSQTAESHPQASVANPQTADAQRLASVANRQTAEAHPLASVANPQTAEAHRLSSLAHSPVCSSFWQFSDINKFCNNRFSQLLLKLSLRKIKQ